MRLSLPTAVVEGAQLTVMPFHEDAVVGTISLPAFLQIVPSPRRGEDQKSLKAASGKIRQHIAAGLGGTWGDAWSTPPITFWHADALATVSDELVPDTGLRTTTIAPGATVVAVDGETQLTAWHDLYDDPESYGLTYPQLMPLRIPFEMYIGLSPADARQIFHDRNVLGVDVAKNLSMSMDQRDLATRLTETVKVEIDGRIEPFSKLVDANKRQVGKTAAEGVTLSALRALAVAALYGRPGLGRSSDTV
ncbi:hypothetical protein OG898_04950 [Streptomyces sp. NBC_00193]|uniref:DNA sulfur modification protein DndB n=1 Tax=Streptomyces sp. NBC_00193 TaxID=2975675 RepID=UPI0022536A86|nr:DNA sulfur modification protein DndB [Streptomyces sp. NBC_00193]MCX5295836.1 hypothetical protein [Streptomyces sp. NBC_00193]